MAAVMSPDSIKARDHAYGQDGQLVRPAGQVNVPLPVPDIARLPPTLTYTPPSNASTSTHTTPSHTPASPQTSRKALVTPPASNSAPGSSMGFFGRRGSVMPGSASGQTRPTSSRSKTSTTEEGIEMAPVKSLTVDTHKLKDEQAMAKWRKWVIEQPVQPQSEHKSSPLRKKGHASPHQISPSLSPTQGRRGDQPGSPLAGSRSPSFSDNQAGPGPSSARPSRVTLDPIGDGDDNVYATESIMALRDVELAVDEDVLKSLEDGRTRLSSRRMSVVPPPFPQSNPFDDIAPRLTSRRVRPLVLELIQALGHYIDAVWSVAHPGQPCPWAEPVASSSTPPADTQWRSKMVTAVQDGRRNGYVDDPPTDRDAQFWESEVRHTLTDVDQVVGIYKGVKFAFDGAMVEGRYGDVHARNVITTGEHGGGLTRLLHDLEEALWGDAAPRSTDLAYELPNDFDPYAIVEDVPANQQRPQPSPGSQMSDPMKTALPTGGGEGAETPESIEQRRIIKVNAWDAALNLDAFKKDGEEEVTLEELGRRRHQEWLESRKADGWAA